MVEKRIEFRCLQATLGTRELARDRSLQTALDASTEIAIVFLEQIEDASNSRQPALSTSIVRGIVGVD